jgi:hypothetical protein
VFSITVGVVDELGVGVEVVNDRLPLVGDLAALVSVEAGEEGLDHESTDTVRGASVQLFGYAEEIEVLTHDGCTVGQLLRSGFESFFEAASLDGKLAQPFADFLACELAGFDEAEQALLAACQFAELLG